MYHARIIGRSLRAGGESQMFAVGFEMQIIKRRGRWVSTAFHQYLWRGEQILSVIGRRMMPNSTNHGRAGGKRTRYNTDAERNAHQRLVEISKCMSAALRHHNRPGITKEGLAPTRKVLRIKGLVDRNATFADILESVDGGCGNNKGRFEINSDRRCIRCTQGHSVGSGVRPDCLPVVANLDYLTHGASQSAA